MGGVTIYIYIYIYIYILRAEELHAFSFEVQLKHSFYLETISKEFKKYSLLVK